MFKAEFICANGHKQTLEYGNGFTREMVEDCCTMMFGGKLHSLGINMPGYGCAYQVSCDDSKCAAKVKWTVTEE